MTIVLLDYGMGNIGSVVNAFANVGVEVSVSNQPETVAKADRLVIPGVGSFDSAMKNLASTSGLLEAINYVAVTMARPTLGICLGAQLLLSKSSEGEEAGLNLIPGCARKLSSQSGIKIPHTGWNEVVKTQKSRLLEGRDSWKFYFVHSFAPFPDNSDFVIAETTHGESFPSAIGKENVFGVQFHPERSHAFGTQLLENFLKL